MGLPLLPALPIEQLAFVSMRAKPGAWPEGLERDVELYDTRTGEVIPSPEDEEETAEE